MMKETYCMDQVRNALENEKTETDEKIKKTSDIIKIIASFAIIPFCYFLGFFRYTQLLGVLGIHMNPTFIYSEPQLLLAGLQMFIFSAIIPFIAIVVFYIFKNQFYKIRPMLLFGVFTIMFNLTALFLYVCNLLPEFIISSYELALLSNEFYYFVVQILLLEFMLIITYFIFKRITFNRVFLGALVLFLWCFFSAYINGGVMNNILWGARPYDMANSIIGDVGSMVSDERISTSSIMKEDGRYITYGILLNIKDSLAYFSPGYAAAYYLPLESVVIIPTSKIELFQASHEDYMEHRDENEKRKKEYEEKGVSP